MEIKTELRQTEINTELRQTEINTELKRLIKLGVIQQLYKDKELSELQYKKLMTKSGSVKEALMPLYHINTSK